MKLVLSAVLALLTVATGIAGAKGAAPRGVELRAYVNDSCIVADEPYLMPPVADPAQENVARSPALLVLVVGKIAEALLNHAVKTSADHIRTGAARKDTHFAVIRETNLYRATFDPVPTLELNGQLGCMTIVAGDFRDEAAGCQQDYLPRTISREIAVLPPEQWHTTRTEDSAANPLRRANICTAGEPLAVYEARIEFSNDGTAYRLRSAGYRVQSLLTAKEANAQRIVFYTVEISQPTGAGKADVLTTAVVNLGRLGGGGRAVEAAGDSTQQDLPWLRVPALSVEARRSYEEQTRVHQEVAGQIDALQRAITRGQRVIAGLDQRIATARPELVKPLRQERLRNEVQIQAHAAELDARRMEYAELPAQPREYMPVSIEVGVTETKSEKPALLALAAVMQQNSGKIATAATSAAGNLVGIGRSLDAKPQGPDELAAALAATRNAYFDAQLRSRTEAGAGSDARAELAAARIAYNNARRALGLEPVP